MLQLRPNCENCGVQLLPDSTDAMICSFECTFCRQCVNTVLENVCPNCGGGFCARPIRPVRQWRGDNFLGGAPASTNRVVKPVDRSAHQIFAAKIKTILPEHR
jgi:uncharacterized protein